MLDNLEFYRILISDLIEMTENSKTQSISDYDNDGKKLNQCSTCVCR